MGAFIFFANEKRQQVKDLNPDLKLTDVTTKLADMWRKLSDTEKEPYQIMSEKDKERFKREMERYNPPDSSSESSESDSDRKKKKKKKSNRPKRPMSSFFFFANERRQNLRDKNPELKVTDVTKTLADMWKKMSEEEKRQYYEMGEREKERFKRENNDYCSIESSNDSDSSRASQTNEKEKSKKRKKPTRPMSAFLHFAREQRQMVREKHPEAKITEITRILASMWRNLTEEEKKPYQLYSTKDKERFREESLQYALPTDTILHSSDSSSESSENERSSRKKKNSKNKKKDPNRPRRPMSAFLHFTLAKRQRVKDKHPEFKVTEIVKKLAKIWRKMSDEKKKKYILMANRDKDRYRKESSKYMPPDKISSSSDIDSSDSDHSSLSD